MLHPKRNSLVHYFKFLLVGKLEKYTYTTLILRLFQQYNFQYTDNYHNLQNLSLSRGNQGLVPVPPPPTLR